MSTKAERLEELARVLDLLADGLRYGCTDRHCVVRPPKGMCTNGGCRCKTMPQRLVDVAAEMEAALKADEP